MTAAAIIQIGDETYPAHVCPRCGMKSIDPAGIVQCMRWHRLNDDFIRGARRLGGKLYGTLKPICSVEGCGGYVEARGFCRSHFRKIRIDQRRKCTRGHELTGDNVTLTERGHRRCMTCAAAKKARKT